MIRARLLRSGTIQNNNRTPFPLPNPPALPLRCVRVHMLCSLLSLKPELGGSSAQDPRDERGALKMRRTSHLGAPTATAPDRSKPRQRAPAHIASLYQARMHVKYVLSPH